jgi:hypothetical protein
MQFNMVNGYNTETNFQAIERKYHQAGYQRPQIVFWNLNGSSSDFPVTMDEYGTAMISGFSPSMLKAVLNGRDFSPYGIFRETIDDERYSQIREILTN